MSRAFLATRNKPRWTHSSCVMTAAREELWSSTTTQLDHRSNIPSLSMSSRKTSVKTRQILFCRAPHRHQIDAVWSLCTATPSTPSTPSARTTPLMLMSPFQSLTLPASLFPRISLIQMTRSLSFRLRTPSSKRNITILLPHKLPSGPNDLLSLLSRTNIVQYPWVQCLQQSFSKLRKGMLGLGKDLSRKLSNVQHANGNSVGATI